MTMGKMRAAQIDRAQGAGPLTVAVSSAGLLSVGRAVVVFTAVLAAVLAAAPPVARAAPRRYKLDPGRSRVTIHVGKTGLFGFAGHEHQVVAGAFHGTATFDPDRVAQSSVDLTFDTGALRVTGQGEPTDDVPKVQEAMVGPDCLDARRFPAVHFVSRAVAATGPDGRDLELRGELTLHGVTRPLTVRVHLELVADALEATGRALLRQTDFGITPISKAGVVKVKDEIAIEWHLRGTTL
jgi:polyisoprenoid-binding protein YceI